MKHVLIVMAMFLHIDVSMAACPNKYDEVHMDNTILTTAESCPAGMTEYYTIDEMCTAHVH